MLEKPRDRIREKRKKEVRTAIKDAAMKLAEQSGWHEVSIRKIANEIGYAAPIVYEHFSDKTSLYHEIVSDGFQLLAEGTHRLISQQESPEGVIHAIAYGRIRFAEENQTLHFLMFDADNPDWQQIEIFKFMKSIKEAMISSIQKLAGKPEKADEYFFNFVCLVTGYTFFQRHQLAGCSPTGFKHLMDSTKMENSFSGSIDRFIESIK